MSLCLGMCSSAWWGGTQRRAVALIKIRPHFQQQEIIYFFFIFVFSFIFSDLRIFYHHHLAFYALILLLYIFRNASSLFPPTLFGCFQVLLIFAMLYCIARQTEANYLKKICAARRQGKSVPLFHLFLCII